MSFKKFSETIKPANDAAPTAPKLAAPKPAEKTPPGTTPSSKS